MTSLLVGPIGQLVTNDPDHGTGPLGVRTDAAVVSEDGVVVWVGDHKDAPPADERIDAEGRAVVPGFVDCHSHLMFDGDRVDEFAARMAGEPYTAGGIASTVRDTRQASDARLAANVSRLVEEARSLGTTTIEIKSGYGLTVSDERRSLRLARLSTEETTFLGAHVVPPEYKGRTDEYVALVAGPMLDACAPDARWADVFCERGAFDADQAREILVRAKRKGLGVRLHANQLGPGPGVQLAVELDAASADHCTYLDKRDIESLSASATVAVLLPGAEFATRSRYPDARRLLDAGVTVALASDCNPGSSYTTSLAFCVALAVRDMGMSCEEALWAVTAGGARALRRTDIGALRPGTRMDLLVLAAPSYRYLAYRPGVPLVERVVTQATAPIREPGLVTKQAQKDHRIARHRRA